MAGFAPYGVPNTPQSGLDAPSWSDALAQAYAKAAQPVSNAIQSATGWTPGTTPSWMPSTNAPSTEQQLQGFNAGLPPKYQISPDDMNTLMSFAAPGMIGGERALEGPIEGGPGWFTGVEGKQKFEISDYGSSANMDPLRAAREQNIQDVLKAQPRNKLGALPENARAKAEDYVDNHIASTARLGDVLNHPRLFDQYPVLADRPVTLKNLGSSSGATTVSGRILLHNNLLDNPDAAHGVLLHEVQHLIQDKEGFAPGTSPRWTGPAMEDILQKQQAVMLDQSRPMAEREAAADDVTRLSAYMSSKNAAYNAYQNTAGEVEARNVEARFKRQQGMVGEAQGDLFKDTRRRLMNRWNYARQFEQGMPLGKYQGIERTESVPPERQFLWPGEAPFNWSAPPSYGLARAGLTEEAQAPSYTPDQQAQADSGRRRLIMNALSQGQ